MSRTRRPTPAPTTNAPSRRIRPSDTVVLVIVLVLASSLAIAGVPTATVLELLAGAGWIAVRLGHGRSEGREVSA